MRRKYYRYSSFGLSRNERIFFSMIIGSVTFLFKAIIFIVKGTYKFIMCASKSIKNLYMIRKTGFAPNNLDELLYKLSPRGFEVFIAELYKAQGHKVILTKESNDYGRDVIVETDEDKIFIECKRYNKNSGSLIGREICQKLLGSMQMFNASKGIICTTGKFHKNAYEVKAMVDNLELMDSIDILAMLMKLDLDKIKRIILKAQNIV